MLSYGRLTIDFGIVVFAKTRWLFSYGVTFLPDGRGDMLFYSVCYLADTLYKLIGELNNDVTNHDIRIMTSHNDDYNDQTYLHKMNSATG